MAFKCSSCGAAISQYSYICSSCGKVCREKVVKLSGKNTIDVNKAKESGVRAAYEKPSMAEPVPASSGGNKKNNRKDNEKDNKKNVVYSENALDGVNFQNTIDINKKGDFDFSKKDNLDPTIEIAGKNSMFNVEELKIDEYRQKTASHIHKEPRSNMRHSDSVHMEDIADVSYKSGKRGGGRAAGERPALLADGFLLDKIITANKNFISNNAISRFDNSKTPDYKLAVLSCACPSMISAVENSMGLSPGAAYVVNVLGSSTVESVSSEVMRSLAVAVHLFGVEEIIVLSHEDCVLKQLSTADLIGAMRANGVSRNDIEINDIKAFCGNFSNCRQNVRKTIAFIHNSKLIPETVAVHGMILAPQNLKLEVVVNGYSERIVI